MHHFNDSFRGKKVLITGHTGFKGSWLTIWLQELGADVVGYSLEPPTTPSFFEIAQLQHSLTHIHGDVRDLPTLQQAINEHKPDLVFHLAAQPLVLDSYELPQETMAVNALGTVNLLEACRGQDTIQAVVIITTDKCYENKEWVWGYRETDPLGGSDPYSASKAMAEIATASYRRSFFSTGIAVATARAGNVIGGGDFSNFRLIPDCMKALAQGLAIEVRNTKSIRPWMHVLDPLHGYLMLAHELMKKGQAFAEAWNFGPQEHEAVTVEQMVEEAIRSWGSGDWVDVSSAEAKPEMNTLKLNWDKAANRLKWRPKYNWQQAIGETVDWYKHFEKGDSKMREVTTDQIRRFSAHAQREEVYS